MDPNIVLTIIGIVIASVLAIIGICISLRNTPRKTLRYSYLLATPLIEAEMFGIQQHTIIVDGQPIKNLIATRVFFSNQGNTVIDSTDFSETMPLRIVAENKIFCPKNGYRVRANDPGAIKLNMIDEKTLGIDCAYIKPRQSFSIYLLHDGSLSVLGELKSGKIIDYIRAAKKNYVILLIIITLLHILFEGVCISLFFTEPDKIQPFVIILCLLYPVLVLFDCTQVDDFRMYNPFRRTHKHKKKHI